MNVVILGQFKNTRLLYKSLDAFNSIKKKINQVILVAWEHEVEAFPQIKKKILEHNVTLVSRPQPKFNNGSIFYQMKAFELGLDSIEDKTKPVFKTRTDLFICAESLLKIIEIDRTIHKKSKLKEKIWIPWFEITKPYYIADECFYSSYEDARKLFNYDISFDKDYDLDAGKSHIRRFIHLDDINQNAVKECLNLFGKSGHGTIKRQKMLDFNLNFLCYAKCMVHYYEFIKTNFRVGIDMTNYIEFRDFSNPKYELIGDVNYDFNSKFSYDYINGTLMSYDESYLNDYLEYFNNLLSRSSDTKREAESLDEKIYIDIREEILRHSFLDKLKTSYFQLHRYLNKFKGYSK